MPAKRVSLNSKQKETPDRRKKNAANSDAASDVGARSAAQGSGSGHSAAPSAVAAEPMDVDTSMLDDANISDDEEGGTRIGDIYIPPPIPPYCSTESKGARLIISKIENLNFKSYAGKVVLGPFHHSFTAIIGPNGSGKSNVIDSMLFVFGYRANKIRCKKISTLLHNSARFQDIQMCSVAVHFHQVEGEDGAKVPNSEIVIQRTAYRDNSSFYTINGRRVHFREVSKLLKQHNVDLDHNRFLILQGEVESIAMMKPKGQNENETGMLEYLEDIVGTSRYIEPLAKIHKRVEQMTEERIEKHNRCKLAERDMKDLEEPYNEAIEYLRMENENTRSQNLKIQKYLSEQYKDLNNFTKQQETIETELKEHDTKAEELQKERREKEEAVREEMAAFDKLRKTKEDIEKKLEKAKKNFTETQQEMKITNQRRKQNKTQLEKTEQELEDLKKVPEKNQFEISECEIKVENLTKQKLNFENELQKNYEVFKEQTKLLIEEREKLETKLVGFREVVEKAKSALTESEQELKILKHDETAETRKFESMRTSYEESKNKLQQHRDRLNELKDSIPTYQEEIVSKTQQMQKLQKEEENMRSKLLTLKAEINEKMASMQTTRSNNRVLDFLMRQKNEGTVPGILGRLGDLGGIDAKYDVAISTCCGRLDNILVETVNAAQQCINLLKQHDVGRATFIALEKVQHWRQHANPINTPENAPRLYDLIHVDDERVRAAFYFVLRDTLVARDLDQGSRIAYGAKRYRVVTLNGDVIETSGTMSGGGRTQMRGKMGTKVQTQTKQSANSSMVTQKALDELQSKAQELQTQINYNQEEQSRLERELQTLRINLKNQEPEIQKLSVTIKSLEEQLPRIHKQLEAQKVRMQQTTTDAGKVKLLEAEIDKKRKKLEESEAAADKVTNEINEIQKKIDTIHGDKVKAVQNKINSLTTQIKKLNGHISKLRVEVTASERNVTKAEKDIETLKADITKAEEELKELCEQRTRYDDSTVQLSKDLEEATKNIENAKSGASGIQKEILVIQKQESDMKLKRVEIDQKLQSVAGKVSELRAKIPHWENKLKPLRLHPIPGEIEPVAPLKTYTEEELAAHTLQDIQYKISVEEEALKKKPNLSCIDEYIKKREVYLERVGILEDITAKRNQMRSLHADVHKKRTDEFNAGYHIITRKLKEMYQMITQGGDAELELVDSMDPFQGVTFSVRPPKKTWKNISNLSGGEKTLSSLALVFALHYYKPSPLYFMDEIDAALDFKNISIVAHYIKERTKNAQFIIISLRSNMFELSDYLVGIYKVRDCTDSITIRNFTPPMPLQPSQQQTQNIAASQRPMTILTSPNMSVEVHDNNDENAENTTPTVVREAAPRSLGIQRQTTFVPPAESTAISQNLQNDMFTTMVVDTGASINSLERNSINTVFKTPLPP